MANRRRALEILAFLALVLFVHRSAVFGHRVFFDRDLEHFLFERQAAFRDAIRSGSLPLWNPFPAFGEPMLVIANSGLLYPATWLALLFSPPVTDILIIVLHTFLAGLGARALALELGLSPAAAFLAGAAWGIGGPVQSCMNLPNVRLGAALLPWAWFAFARYGRTARPRDAVLAGLVLGACLLAPSPESTFIAATGVVFCLEPGTPSPFAARVRRALLAAGIALPVGIGLGAVQWLPTIVTTRSAVRNAFGSSLRGAWSIHPAALLQTIVPLPFEDLPLKNALRGTFFDDREPLFYSPYVGLAIVVFAVAALLGPRRRGRVLLAAIAVVWLCLSLGRHGWLWRALETFPPLSLIRYPARFLIPALLPVAVLAGFGYDAVRGPRAGGAARWLIAGLCLLGVAVAIGTMSRPESFVWRRFLIPPSEFGAWQSSPSFARTLRTIAWVPVWAVPAIAAVLVGGLPRGRQGARMWAVVGMAAAIGELACAAPVINATVPAALLAQVPPALALIPRERPNRTFVIPYFSPATPALIGRAGPQYHVYDATPEQKLWYGRYYPLDGLGTPGHGIESVPPDVTALRSLESSRWIEALNLSVGQPWFARMVELSGIQYVIALHDLPLDRFQLLSVAEGLFRPVRTYRVIDPLPRVFAAAGVRRASGNAAIQVLLDEHLDPRATVVLAEAPEAPPARAGAVRVREMRFDAIVMEAEMEQAGHVVLLETYDAGWKATVDGRPAVVERANVAFRSVPVPAGRHTIEMRYRPWGVTVGVGIALATLVALLVLAVAGRRRAAGARLAKPLP